MDRKTTSAFAVLVTVTMLFASIAVAWFGPTSGVQGIPGFFAPFESGSVWALFAAPAVLTVLGLIGE